MNAKTTIEIDAETAKALEARAAREGVSIPELVAELVRVDDSGSANLETLRAGGRGPWAPEMLAEDARRFADFQLTGQGVPWDEVKAWMQSWGTAHELPAPEPRKL